MHFHTLTLAALAAAAAAIDTSNITDVTCGKTTYKAKQVQLAWAEGCRLFDSNQTVGTGKYPHTFNNRESLSFSADGPYQEFPIVEKGKFGGNAKRSSIGKGKGKGKAKNNNNPGADRIVFNPDLNGDCVYVGAMTHTGAEQQNGFVECEMAEADDESVGAAVAPTWVMAASGLAAYWAMGM